MAGLRGPNPPPPATGAGMVAAMSTLLADHPGRRCGLVALRCFVALHFIALRGCLRPPPRNAMQRVTKPAAHPAWSGLVRVRNTPGRRPRRAKTSRRTVRPILTAAGRQHLL